MHLHTRPRTLSLALKSLFGAVATAVVLTSATAAGLGKLTVLSSLGQPLRAEIELTSVSADEAAGLVAKLASPDAFKLANVEFNPALLGLRFAVEQRGSRQVINVTSSAPVNEPFVDMLLELSWSSGRLVREYTFLLDPAELRATQSAQVAAAPVDVLNQGARPLPPARSARQGSALQGAGQPGTPRESAREAAREGAREAASARQRAERAPADTPLQDKAASEVTVRPGDTLGRIAARIKPTDISLDMMLVALYRANPDAFVGNNMNRLKSGQILSVPDADAIRGGSDSAAHGVVVAHAADFNAYRNKLAGQVASAAPTRSPEAAQSAAGKVTAKVEERPTAANESKDQLKLSKADATGAAAGGKSAAADAEDKIAKERALADASARVKELEKNVNDLEKLMVVKSKAGTEASKPAEAAVSAPAVVPAPVAVAPKPAARPVVKPAPPPAAPTLAETLMDNITLIGAGLAVLLLAAFAVVRRRKPAGPAPTEPSILGAPTDQAQSMFAETGGASVDTSNSVFNSSFAPSASQLDTNEVDPIAEADVYIAYGRDAQAEEILKEALRSHPERHPVRLKLLEIYAARKDLRAFETQASELYAMTKGQGEEWPQAAALGLSIDPTNPLYAGAAAGAAVGLLSADELAEQEVLRQMALASGEVIDFDEADVVKTALPTPAEDNSLDFDLGSLSFDEPPPVAAPQPLAGNNMEFTSDAPVESIIAPDLPADEETFDLSFDMDFDKPVAAAPAPLPSLDNIHLDLANPDLPSDVNTIDFSGAFDVPELPTLPGSPASEAMAFPAVAATGAYSEQAPLVNPLDDLDAMSFDLPTTPSAAAPETITAPTLEDDPFGLPDFTRSASPALGSGSDLPELAFAMPESASAPLPDFAAPTPAYASAPHFDMSGIDLDLPSETPHHAGFDDLAPVAAPPLAAAELSAAHMEMETKIDLAIAYQEIGDKEGARELLDEVIKGGSNEQIGRANEMRVKLA
ncbi:FimV/HubP family polar landmark protein [Massilia sp. DWR3-1-1]|uniref:FimV/HubP family polar landmark protein n=1 Tax=Massilia sp. DWR3-1-1 TaxID=2804559 RepID=UPI003CEE075B